MSISRYSGRGFDCRSRSLPWALVLALSASLLVPGSLLTAQQAASSGILPLEMVVGRSFPVVSAMPITKVTVANPEVADAVVIGESEVVINAIAVGETDVILWGAASNRRHYRVTVRSMQDRRQILLGVKFAEVRKEALRNITSSLRAQEKAGDYRVGAGQFRDDNRINLDGSVNLPGQRFLTFLSNFNTDAFLALLEAEEQRGNARLLAEPNLMAANLEEASFLAGGEFPIPVVQGGAGGGGQQGGAPITIQFREFGIRLNFRGEVLSDSLLKLRVRPEVSSLDFGNGVTLQGFTVPALRSRRVESTVDVLSNRSLIISGLFNEERELIKTGIPFLLNVPILGDLLSSQRWQRSESELIVVVTPIVMDPNRPRVEDTVELLPEDRKGAKAAIEKRVVPPAAPQIP